MNQVAKRTEAPELVPTTVDETSAIVSMIARAARDPAVDIDKMERLMKMHTSMLDRSARVEFDAAMAEMQPDLPVVDRKGKIEIKAKDAKGERTGAIQQSTPYALWEDINEAIRPVLKKHGFSLSFRTGTDDKGLILVTGILSHRGGHREETRLSLQHDSTGSKNAVQAVKSSISYGKRITAEALLNLTSRGEDDDAKSAVKTDAIDEKQLLELVALADEVRADKARFCTHFKIERMDDLPTHRLSEATALLEAKRSQK